MSKIIGISFSYAKNSMNTRGLTLMNLNSVYDMTDFDMPICNVNIADGNVPSSVQDFIKVLRDADILVFAIPENTAHYGAGFKNAMDWLICASNYNADLGQDGPFFNKPIYVITFTPSYKPSGDRHFDMTKHLLQDKMGGLVYNSFVKNGGWIECVPGNTTWVQHECEEIFNTTMPKPHVNTKDWKNMPKNWVEQYNIWDKKWEN